MPRWECYNFCMMVKIERTSAKLVTYCLYIVAAILGFVLAFLNIHGRPGSQLFGDGITLGGTAYADAPVGCGGSGDGGTLGGTGSCCGEVGCDSGSTGTSCGTSGCADAGSADAGGTGEGGTGDGGSGDGGSGDGGTGGSGGTGGE